MDKLQKGNVVKTKDSDNLMIINDSFVDRGAFNKAVFDYLDDKPSTPDKEVIIYVCFVEENGITKKLEFKRDDLIFVRASY